MNLPQIRIESQLAKIAMSTTPAVQHISQPKADLSIEQPMAEMIIHRTPPRLTIDQSQAWADMGLKPILQLMDEFVVEGKQAAVSGMARRSQEGDELMRIENGGNPLVAQAERNSQAPIYDFNIGWIPSINSVKINHEPGNLDIQWKIHTRPMIHVNVNKPVIDYTPGDVHIKMAQYPSLKIDVANLKFVGVNYEQLI